MNSIEEAAIYDAAAKKWKFEEQVIAMAEECGELVVECCKLNLGKNKEGMEGMLEEMADVQIMLDQMRHTYFKPRDMDQWKAIKLRKLRGILLAPQQR